jgi:hypothetical protein
VVEEGLADMPRRPAPMPERVKNVEASLPSIFEPSPPAEVRRAGPRMPEVGDFPAHAQREYYTKMSGPGATPEASPPDRAVAHRPRPESSRNDEARKDRAEQETDAAEAPVRAGFLKRLAMGQRR